MIIYIPAYFKNMTKGSSQYLVAERQYNWLKQIDSVIALVPNHPCTEFIDLFDKKLQLDLPLGGRYPNTINPEYARAIMRLGMNDKLIVSAQAVNAFDLYKELWQPPYQFPKIVLTYVENIEDFPKNDPRTKSILLGFMNLPFVANSNALLSDFKELASKYYLPSEVNKINATYVNLGLDLEGLSKISKEKHNIPTFIHAGNSVTGFKNFKTQVLFYDYLYARAVKFRVKMFLNEKSYDIVMALKKPYIEVNRSVDHDQYMQEAAKCHYFIYTSKSESYGFAIWELLAMNVVGLIMKKDWFTNIQNSTHPFEFENVTQALSLAGIIMNDYDKAAKRQSDWWIAEKDNHSINNSKLEFIRVINEYKKLYKL